MSNEYNEVFEQENDEELKWAIQDVIDHPDTYAFDPTYVKWCKDISLLMEDVALLMETEMDY